MFLGCLAVDRSSLGCVLPPSRMTSQDISSLPFTSHSVRIAWWCWPITMIPDTSQAATPELWLDPLSFHTRPRWGCTSEFCFICFSDGAWCQVALLVLSGFGDIGEPLSCAQIWQKQLYPQRHATIKSDYLLVWMAKQAWSVLLTWVSTCSRPWSNV
jgi:hypothetical protein